MAAKEYNKTILQTSFTSLESIYYLLQTVKENQPMTHNEGTDSVFPKARARVSQARGGEWDEEKRDTHAELTLKEMGLIRYIDKGSKFEVSDIGYDFLAAFSLTEQPVSNGKVSLSLLPLIDKEHYYLLLFEILSRISVSQEKYGRDIHPYLILFKLLSEPLLGGYISKQEWACYINDSNFLLDSQYEEIKTRILNFRAMGESCEIKKCDRILTRLVLWNILDRVNIFNDDSNYFCLNDDFIPILKIYSISGSISSKESIVSRTHRRGLINRAYTRYFSAIKTKPFIILGGFSGTGKSQKVKELAYLTCPSELQDNKCPENYCLISVKPNWHDSRDLLGYPSSIAKNYRVTEFMKFLVKAMKYPNTPFYCCMDEMNLAQVEEYFAEYLSVIEDRKKVNGIIVSSALVKDSVFDNGKYDSKFDIFKSLGLDVNDATDAAIIDSLKKEGLCIPSNLVVIGTVNMDDTTSSFSRKVIDRALIFETDIDKFSADTYFSTANPLQYANVDGKPFICDEIKDEQAMQDPNFIFSAQEQQDVITFINDLNSAMSGTEFQISYRVLNETILYYRSLQLLDPDHADLERAMNDIMLMKVLPRIEGDIKAKHALDGIYNYLRSRPGFPDGLKGIQYDESLDDSLKDYAWSGSYMKVLYMKHLFEIGEGFTRYWK